MKIVVIRDRESLARVRAGLREGKKTLGLVPTMGALHDGHLSLVAQAGAQCDAVMATIFVNPLQFGPKEDFSKYPRTLDDDIAKLDKAGAAYVYTPANDVVYPAGFSTLVSVKGLSDGLEGAFRPGFFDGVATVVAKLLLQTLPEIAIFGEKDYQQLLVIRKMASDLDIPVKIFGGATVREADGLAMSSRNRYLTAQERQVAPRLFAVMKEAANKVLADHMDAAEAMAWGKRALLGAGFAKVDYLELRAADTLGPLQGLDEPARLLAAVWLGTTRLIDNIAAGPISSLRN
jgi:pantoate--beta-alanine ligase